MTNPENPLDLKWSELPALKILALFLILLPPAIYSFFIYSYSLNIPFSDDFAELQQLVIINQTNVLKEKLSLIFAQHTEPRPAFNRAVHILFYSILGEADFRVLAFVGNTALLGLLYIFYKILHVPLAKRFIFIPVVILLFQLQGWVNMTWVSSSLANQFVLFFAGFSFYLLAGKSSIRFYGALLFAAIGAFTQGHGLGILAVGLISLLVQKRYGQSLVWLAGGILIGLFYFTGYRAPPSSGPDFNLLSFVTNGGLYFFSFLGSTLSLNNISAAPIWGIIITGYFIFLTWSKYYFKNPAVYSFMVLIILSAGMASVARSGLGLEQAFSPRYKIISTTMVILIYISLAELLCSKSDRIRPFLAVTILLALAGYTFLFTEGKFRLAHQKITMTGRLNQWVDLNSGLYYPDEKVANAILTEAIQEKTYKLPYHLLSIPENKFSSSLPSPDLCPRESETRVQANFSVIPVGPENAPFLVRVEGMIYDPPVPNNEESSVHIVLRSRKGDYIFTTHPQRRPSNSVYFRGNVSNTGFIALIPFQKLEDGVYRTGFCRGGTAGFNDYFISKQGGRLTTSGKLPES